MGLRILKQLKFYFLGVTVLFGAMSCKNVFASEKYPLTFDEPDGQEEPYVTLTEYDEDYIVLPGDSLWRIAERLFGDGRYYMALAASNQDILADPDLIYPGMTLHISRTGCITRTEAKYGGVQMGRYSMDMPYGWTVGTAWSGDAGGNFVMSNEGSIACLIQDLKKETLKTVKDWEQECIPQMIDYVKENYNDQVSDLCFARYSMKDQKDTSGELYLYSYVWHISPADYPDLTCKVCMGLKLTDHIQAEFLGYTLEDDYDIQGVVRYVTATFEEHFDPESADPFTVNDSNMCILPETEWAFKGMYDSFAYIDEFFTSLLNRAAGTEEKEMSGREKLLDRIRR